MATDEPNSEGIELTEISFIHDVSYTASISRFTSSDVTVLTTDCNIPAAATLSDWTFNRLSKFSSGSPMHSSFEPRNATHHSPSTIIDPLVSHSPLVFDPVQLDDNNGTSRLFRPR